MVDKIFRLGLGLAAVVTLNALSVSADQHTSDVELAKRDRIGALEEKVELLTQELARVKQEVVVPDETPRLESYQGLGPAASKVYGLSQGLSIGGYAEGYYRRFVNDTRGDPAGGNGKGDGTRTAAACRWRGQGGGREPSTPCTVRT